MNIKQAVAETADFATMVASGQNRYTIRQEFFNHPSIGYAHILEMRDRIFAENMSDAKMDRWLGWMQCAIVTWSPDISVEDIKEINRKWA